MHFAAAWAPYFDDIDAIIYLAPVSGFDEVRNFSFNVSVISNPLLGATRRCFHQQTRECRLHII